MPSITCLVISLFELYIVVWLLKLKIQLRHEKLLSAIFFLYYLFALYAIWLLDPCCTTNSIKASFLQFCSVIYVAPVCIVCFWWLCGISSSFNGHQILMHLSVILLLPVSNCQSFFVSYASAVTYLMTFVLIFDHRDSSSSITDMTPDERREQQKQEEALHASSLRVPRRHVYSLNIATVAGFINRVFLPDGLMYFTFLECKTH